MGLIREINVIVAVVGSLAATGFAIYLAWNGLAHWRELALLGVLYCLGTVPTTPIFALPDRRDCLYWWHFELSWLMIQLMAKLGRAHDVYTLDEEDLRRALESRSAGVKVALFYPSGHLQPTAGMEPAVTGTTLSSTEVAIGQSGGIHDVSHD